MSKIEPINQSTEGIIYTFMRPVKGFNSDKPIQFSVEYSGAENNILEFECIRVDDSSLTKSQILDLEDTLECGYEEKLVNELEKIYLGTPVKFSPNHYDSCL
jgi:hypothetical protein